MPLRLVVFDFDGTMSTSHVWNSLSGAGPSPTPVLPPFARSERGQLVKIIETDRSDLYGGPGGFAAAAFGGLERIELLHRLMNHLQGCGVEMVICSRSLVGPLRKLLEQVGLLPYFSTVFGNIGGIDPLTDFDMQLPPAFSSELAPYMGSGLCSINGSKSQTIRTCMEKRGLVREEVIFVDDMPQEIQEVSGTCKTLHVEPLCGMGIKEIEFLHHLATQGRGAFEAVHNGFGLSPPPPPPAPPVMSPRDAPVFNDPYDDYAKSYHGVEKHLQLDYAPAEERIKNHVYMTPGRGPEDWRSMSPGMMGPDTYLVREDTYDDEPRGVWRCCGKKMFHISR